MYKPKGTRFKMDKNIICHHCGKNNDKNISEFNIFPKNYIKKYNYYLYSSLNDVLGIFKIYLCKNCLAIYSEKRDMAFPPENKTFFQWIGENKGKYMIDKYYKIISIKRKLNALLKHSKFMPKEKIDEFLKSVGLETVDLDKINDKLTRCETEIEKICKELKPDYNYYIEAFEKKKIAEHINNNVLEYIKSFNPPYFPKFMISFYISKTKDILKCINKKKQKLKNYETIYS